MGNDPPGEERFWGFPPPGGTSESGQEPQKSTVWDMSVLTYLGGAGDRVDGWDQGVHFPPLEHSQTTHCNLSYHGIVADGGAEAGTVPTQAMVGASRSWFHRDKSEDCSSRGGVGQTGAEESGVEGE